MVRYNVQTQTSKMASRRICLVVSVCIAVSQLPTSKAYRITRSPDRMEVVIPDYSIERGSHEYQERGDEETTYWNQEGKKYESKGESDYEKQEKNSEVNKDKYENEKEYREKQQETNANNAEDRYNNEKNNAEEDQRAREEHYSKQEGDGNSENFQSEGEVRANNVNSESESKAERYGDKGADEMYKEENKVENNDIEGKTPSFNYENN
ncbi:hypothetical protein MSG28_005939 [Choristoneura fumiferana]|uniref:Uncharacterized protein n=1 Tax=Choristoneura fumiferana TaxID=7141 RepID=A0ACC0L1D9_CHOFU|nr:hypothetical protein MSG28_005939 [Choristoneura fumiferana]